MSIEIAGLLTHFFQNCQTSENSSTQLQHKELPKVKTTLTKVNGSWYVDDTMDVTLNGISDDENNDETMNVTIIGNGDNDSNGNDGNNDNNDNNNDNNDNEKWQ